VERLAGLDGNDSIYPPSIANDFVAAVGGVGKFVDEVPGDPVPHVKVGVPAVKTISCLAVVGLCGVGNVVLSVA